MHRQSVDRVRLERALRIVAAIVARPGGEVYVPIFERLERELAALDHARSAVDRARAMTDGVSPRRGPAIRPAAPDLGPRRI